MSSIKVRHADLSTQRDAAALLEIMESYALGDTGTGLSQYTRNHLADRLHAIPHGFTLLAELNQLPIGLANCFMQFSTFQCRPLLNIHDLAVLPAWRGRGIGSTLLAAVAEEARKRDCCKITLEVLSGNHGAQRLYQRHGFQAYRLNDTTGHAMFWECPLRQ
ncbi:GNAT family N-acetyltransferase [Spirochaeta africana]|uniref:Acetyltransferase n=1 Tax=Spirochaeta africana (strain ATCC 700263 / DSM 8902 / Z-7692) TaxID=889378 RepID=H9UGR1_SPIAZ|nr:GNAT family N-acetyltransferase [Spirochaeta africana]AFG36704.1 acetyltransferase [Spirochaeta africana DSM 8902]